ncbi:uncharacterized protein LOC143434951 isoform X2 [Arvicanthis niloticus]|uniref:uncharacterized protein LOC143434951 isoform X2 n=1 Tax=Arvicanthis niloticus TaxID=61156 RepID=UPI00403D2544
MKEKMGAAKDECSKLQIKTAVKTSQRRCTKCGYTNTQSLKLLLLIILTCLLRAINFLPGQCSDEVREPDTLTSKYPISYRVKQR